MGQKEQTRTFGCSCLLCIVLLYADLAHFFPNIYLCVIICDARLNACLRRVFLYALVHSNVFFFV